MAVVASWLIARPATAATARVATFNLALYGAKSGEVLARLEAGDDAQARHLAEIIQRVRPDVLVLNEIDYDPEGRVLAAFCDKYLAAPQHASQSPDGPADAIVYPHRMAFEANTGVHSGLDLDGNGRVDATPGARDYAGDCWGYGVYPGQYAFAVVSKFPIDAAAIRQFRTFKWKNMPGNRLPDNPQTSAPADWYRPEVRDHVRLSSKNHCDVPLMFDGRRIHLLLSHPTPPVFDGPEDRNGRRNHDELRLWVDYVSGSHDANYIVDDAGRRGGLAAGEPFVILGDLNGDAHDGDGKEGIALLLAAPRVLQYAFPTSQGAVEAARLQGGANARHVGDPAQDTEDAADGPGPGNLHLDYVLPSAELRVVDSGVFWPETSDPLAALVRGAEHPASSDHRLTWIDMAY